MDRPVCDCEDCQELCNTPEGREFCEDLWEMENGPMRNDFRMTIEESRAARENQD